MDNTHIALKKILNMMVPKKYPVVLDIKVIDDSYEYNDIEKYTVFLGINYNEYDRNSGSDIREYVREVSSYVLQGDETLKILFYNPETF